MTSNEKSSRRKIRISIIDVMIIITVIACMLGLFFHYKIYEKENEVITSYSCFVSIVFEGLSPEISKNISVGDKVFGPFGELGTVTAVEEDDHSVYYTNSKNEIVNGADTSKRDVTVSLTVKGDVRDDGFYANGIDFIASGMKLDFYTSDFSGNGLIFDIQQQSE